MSESELQREIMKAVTEAGGRVFRNNVGIGWAGKLENKCATRNGFTVVLSAARPLHSGLCTGSSDLIGFYGSRFLAIEVKVGRRVITDEQENFLEQVRAAGGIALCARSVEEVLDALKNSI